MRAVIQRVTEGRVLVGGDLIGEIKAGLVVLLGVSTNDGPSDASWMASKIATLRIFPDDEDRMNLSVADIGGEVLVVSQFTLFGDARKGRRPSFVRAAGGSQAENLYEAVVADLGRAGLRTATGRFGAMMNVELTNDGPVTILLDSEGTF